MITAERGTALYEFCRVVSRMNPGDAICFDRHHINAIPIFDHNGARFTPADRVLENIVGSAYTHSYSVNPASGAVTFRRHDDGVRRYVSPDRRDLPRKGE